MSQLFETAILIVVVLMIFGVVLSAHEEMAGKITKTTEENSMERTLNELCDNLINNPGSPEWWKYQSGTVGLAITDSDNNTVPNSVSYEKLMVLLNNYDKLITDKYKVKTSLKLEPVDSCVGEISMGHTGTDEVYSVNRMVKCDFFKKYVLKNFENTGKCNHRHKQSEYSCSYFKIFKGNLKTSDYYLVSDEDDLSYIVDTTRVVKEREWESMTTERVYLNPLIDFYEDTSAVVFIHLDKPSAHAFIISVPKSFNPDYLSYDYFKTNECRLTLTGYV